jgi:hypothetical protein
MLAKSASSVAMLAYYALFAELIDFAAMDIGNPYEITKGTGE